MKKIITTICSIAFCICAGAQEGLYVEDLFDGKVISPKMMYETVIRGRS